MAYGGSDSLHGVTELKTRGFCCIVNTSADGKANDKAPSKGKYFFL